jgi:hypothetical protein
MIDVKTCGAKGDGLTDDTAALQAAIVKAQISDGEVYVPSGAYRTTSALTISRSIGVRGPNNFAAMLLQQCALGFNIVSPDPVSIECLRLQIQNAQGTGITLQTGHSSIFSKLRVDGGHNGIVFVAADTWHVQQCEFNQFTGHGIEVANTVNADDGDGEISGCTFASVPGNGSVAIYQKSSGGLRIVNCKVNGCNVGYMLEADGGPTGDILITGCSIENQAIAGIYMTTKGPDWINAVITGNEFENQYAPIDITGPPGWLSGVAITGNVITTFVPAAAGIVIDGVSNGAISGNVIQALPGIAHIAQGANNSNLVITGNI